MLAAAALGALGAQLEQLQAAKQDWFVGASLVDEQDISLEADGAVTVRRQAFDKALRNCRFATPTMASQEAYFSSPTTSEEALLSHTHTEEANLRSVPCQKILPSVMMYLV